MEDYLSDPQPFADVHGGMADYTLMNKGVTPLFYVIPVKDELASEREGVARFKDMEVVLIRTTTVAEGASQSEEQRQGQSRCAQRSAKCELQRMRNAHVS